MPVAGRVTGCGRAGRVKEGRYHPRPFPSLLPLTRCGAGDWMWVTGRAGRVDGWGAGCGFIIPTASPGRAGRVGDWRLDVVVLAAGHYHAPPHFPPFFPPSPLSPVAAVLGDWMWSCWPRETKSLSCPPFPLLLTRCEAGWSCWPRG